MSAGGAVQMFEVPSRFVGKSLLTFREAVELHGALAKAVDNAVADERRIAHAVAAEFDMRPLDLVADTRLARVAWPRQVAIFLYRRVTPLSLAAIGEKFQRNGRPMDHGNVLYAVRKVQGRMDVDPAFRQTVERLLAKTGKGKARNGNGH